jgi:hypothetical protein
MMAPRDPMAPFWGLLAALLIGISVLFGITYALIQTVPDQTVYTCESGGGTCPNAI